MYRKLLPWCIDPYKTPLCIKPIDNCHLKDKTFTLLNWNVHKNNHSFQWLHDFHHILHHYSPDLITFQEYQTKSKRSILDQNRDYGYGFFPNIQMRGKEYGLLNASKSLIDLCNPLYSQHLEPLIKTPKVSLFTQYKLFDGQKLAIINTHMINFVQSDKYLAQIKQLEKLCKDHQKLILTGDFNTWNTRRMHLLQEMTKALGLTQIDFEINHHKKRYFAHALDHVFYKGLTPKKQTILHKIKTSDHKPLIVTFSH
ncbi:MAG: endonuclease/exonuclease/phosphatase family protein [Epsilonproteobacteria bacterium]|nr:endonuclease/exonuclease/phosphatase family protein [Campylobacterota bacterium]